jgi:hypothetical protein
VIAAESATNAKEGGGLVPTVAFGVPSSAGMAILLGAFLIQGLVPGPEMLTKHLDITYSMVWSIALANVVGSGLCFAFSGQLAKLATLRYTLIMPVVLSLVYIGAFQSSRSWGDLLSLLFFGVLGWGMKHFKWPRPPLVLGFILGGILERYLFISIERYGVEWMLRPVVVILFIMAILTVSRPFLQDIRAHGGVRGMLLDFGKPRFSGMNLFPLALLCLFCAMLAEAFEWQFAARIVPTVAGVGALLFCALSLFDDVFRVRSDRSQTDPTAAAKAAIQKKIHMDIASTIQHMPLATILGRGTVFFGWMVAFLGSMGAIGLLPTVPIFITAYMKLEGNERWRHIIPMFVVMTLLIYVVFDQLLTVPWPPTLLGYYFPVMKAIPSV